MFAAFATQLRRLPEVSATVLELGSGPGFLANYLLEALPRFRFTLLDFSSAMHDLARARLAERADDVRFLTCDFREPGWTDGLKGFDAVITNQAVHELRHKRYAPTLHGRVTSVLKPGAPYLVCDHFAGEGGMKNEQLFMTVGEQRQALLDAGFRSVEQVAIAGALVLHRAA